MAKGDRKIVLSSKKEQEIESAYLNSKIGKLLYYVTILGVIILLAGLLVALYGTLTLKVNFDIQDSSAKCLLLLGGIICAISLLFYIKFSCDFNNNKSKSVAKSTKKPATKTVSKTKTSSKVVSKETKPKKKTVTKKK